MKPSKLMPLLTVVLFMSACSKAPQSGGTPSVQLPKLNGLEYGMLEKGDLVATENSLAGTGKILFNQPRADEDSNYSFTLSLPDGGASTLFANGAAELRDAVGIKLLRVDTKLKAFIVTDKIEEVSSDFSMVAAQAPLFVEVDVHGHGHIIVWVDHQEIGAYTFKSGPGRLWGFELNKATVSNIKVGAPKEDH